MSSVVNLLVYLLKYNDNKLNTLTNKTYFSFLYTIFIGIIIRPLFK